MTSRSRATLHAIVLAAGALVVVATLFWRRSRLFAATSAAQAKADTAP